MLPRRTLSLPSTLALPGIAAAQPAAPHDRQALRADA
jgi:hypothetical protein